MSGQDIGQTVVPSGPRKRVNRSFISEWTHKEPCPTCGGEVAKGQRARYNPEGQVVHHSHQGKADERPPVICPRCYMAQPCGCDE